MNKRKKRMKPFFLKLFNINDCQVRQHAGIIKGKKMYLDEARSKNPASETGVLILLIIGDGAIR